MRRRLLTAMLLMAAVALAGFGLPLALSVPSLYRGQALLVLSQQAAEAAVVVPGSFAREADPPELPDFGPDVAVGLYDRTGRRVLGTGPVRADAQVQQALRGTAARRSGLLVVAVPVSDNEQVVGAVRVAAPADAVGRRTLRTWLAMAALAVLVLAAAGVLAAERSRRLSRPLDQLREDALLLGTGEVPRVRRATGSEEVDAVRGALVAADERVKDALHRERALSADLAHQLRTPLTSLRLRLEGEQLFPADRHDLLEDLLVDVDRLTETIEDLLSLARDTQGPRPAHLLGTSVRDAGQRWAGPLTAAGRTLVLDVDRDLPWVQASAGALRQVLDVLLDNALHHGAGTVRLAAYRLGSGAVVSVRDQGTELVDPEHLFDRRGPGARGSGIGLALARRLAEAEGLRLVLAAPGPPPAFHLVVPAGAEARADA